MKMDAEIEIYGNRGNNHVTVSNSVFQESIKSDTCTNLTASDSSDNCEPETLFVDDDIGQTNGKRGMPSVGTLVMSWLSVSNMYKSGKFHLDLKLLTKMKMKSLLRKFGKGEPVTPILQFILIQILNRKALISLK